MAEDRIGPRTSSLRPSRARRFVGAVTAAFLVGSVSAAFASGAPAAPRRAAAPVPGTTCNVFPADNIWNADISKLPVNPKSSAWLASMNSGSTNLHPDFGRPPYGLPFAVVDNTHATVHIKFQYASESDPGPYPFGPDIPLEQGSDHHALMINKDTCVLYELFAANWNGGSPKAGSGAIFD